MSIKKTILDKEELVYAILWFIAAVACAFFIILPAKQAKNATQNYDDYIGVTYTFKSSEFVHKYKHNDYYVITVEEEEKPLQIPEIYLSAVNKKNLAALAHGDTVQCYVEPNSNTNYAYSIVEMYRNNTPIITLEDHNANGIANATVGLIFIPILSIALLSMSIYHVVKFIKSRRDITSATGLCFLRLFVIGNAYPT